MPKTLDETEEVPTDDAPATPSTDEAAEDAAFAAGYGSDDPTPIPTGEEPPPVGDQAPVQEPPPPTLKEWTQEEYEQAMAAAREIGTLKTAVEQLRSTAFGRIGGIERVLQDKQAQTPAGEALQLSAEDFAEMQKDFPDLLDMTLKGFNRALAKVKGTGGLSEEAFNQKVDTLVNTRVESRVTASRQEIVLDLMDSVREDWRTVVTSKEYTDWLAALPADQKATIEGSWKPSVVLKSIKDFETTKQPARPSTPPASPPRNRRMASAVAPRGAGGAGPSVVTEDDAFNEGYKTGLVRSA